MILMVPDHYGYGNSDGTSMTGPIGLTAVIELPV
jgi:hypothetical protein